jgi:hypothetical protein
VLLENATAYHGGECRSAGGVCALVVSGAADHCPDDLRFVKEAVERELGFNEGNARVINVMRAWMKSEGAAALERLPIALRDASALAEGFSRLLIDMALFDEAEHLLLRCYNARMVEYGVNDARTLSAQQLLSYLRHKQGNDAAALALTEAIYEGRQSTLGDEHSDTLCSRFFLVCGAFATGDCGMHTEVEALGTTCFEELKYLIPKLTHSLGCEHPISLAARVKNAELLYSLFEMEENDPDIAIMACDEALQALRILRKRLGISHPKTLTLMQRCAELFAKSGEPKKAASQYRALLPLQRRTLGPAHDGTLCTLDTLAEILKDYDSTTLEAIELYLELFGAAQRGLIASSTFCDAKDC